MSLQFEVAGIVFGEARANLNYHYHYPVQYTRLICRRRKKNKTGVLHRVIAVFWSSILFLEIIQSYLQFDSSGIVFGEVRANLNAQYIYRVLFSRLICRSRKRNKAGVLHRVFAIVFVMSIFCTII